MTMTVVVSQNDSRTLAAIERELERDPHLVSPHTRRVYRGALRRFEGWRGPRPMTRLLAEEYAAALRREGYAPATINRALSAIRWWASRVRELAFEDSSMERSLRDEVAVQAERVASVENVKGLRLPKGRHLADGEVRRLLNACAADASLAGLRDVALLATAWATGARQAELAGLQVSDVALDEGAELATLTIRHGKGDKERQIEVHATTYETLVDWLARRGDRPGVLFCPLKKGQRLRFRDRLGHESMRRLLAERAEQARLVEPVTWHDFRRTFIGNLLNLQVDLVVAQKLAGHADPKTTALYDRRDDEVKRQAVQKLRLPYQRRTLPIG